MENNILLMTLPYISVKQPEMDCGNSVVFLGVVLRPWGKGMACQEIFFTAAHLVNHFLWK